MITRVDERLREEARRFRLVFSCRDCAHFDDARAECSLGFPNEAHRSPELAGERVVFCKAFEL